MTKIHIVGLALAMAVACARTPPSASHPIAAPVPIDPNERELTATLDAFIQQLASAPDLALATTGLPMPEHCLPLSPLAPGPDRASRAQRLADDWRGAGLHSVTVHGDEAEASVGPIRPAMTTLCFRRVSGAWHVVGWMPGE